MPESTHKGERVNKVNYVEFYRLGEFITKMRGLFTERQTTYEDAAKMATEQLGFTVTPDNVRSCATKLELHWLKNTNPKGGNHAQRFDALDAKLREIEGHARSLEELLVSQGKLIDDQAKKLRETQAHADQLRMLVHHLFTATHVKPPAGYVVPPASRSALNASHQ